ncbi:hypothetical protein [Atopobium fossor]|uniref:hypothetical protein n=1 Tax=Atopobium fossor TaxID=39487 RepID=UPI000416504D|nr:hypothetical protein [Atopobium fossor]
MVKLDNTRNTERYKLFAKNYDTTDPIIDDILVDYCDICELMDNERRVLQSEGTTVEGLHKTETSPHLHTFNKLMSQKKAALSMLKIATAVSPAGGDELDSFLQG